MKQLYFRQLVILAMLLFVPSFVRAEDVSGTMESSTLFWAVIIILVILIGALLAVMSMLFTLKNVLDQDAKKQAIATGAEVPESTSIWKNFTQSLWNRASVEEEKDLVIDHDFDGIKELDNHLPPWWLYSFYGTIIWGIAYVLVYHVFESAPLQIEEYNNEIAAAEASLIKFREKNPEKKIDLTNYTFSSDAVQIANGGKIFGGQCATCHKADGGGLAGPNLTDKFWKNGGSASAIYNVVTNGVANTAMIAWGGTFNASQISDIVAYVHSLQGTNPAGALGPDGKEYIAEKIIDTTTAMIQKDSVATDTVSDTITVDVEAAKKLFTACAACHKADGGGLIGPNLTDEFWKNGGSKEAIINTISEGIAGTSMAPFKGTYSEDEIDTLTDYILSLQGSNPDGAKEAEGEKYDAH